jgi:hypothetical protein
MVVDCQMCATVSRGSSNSGICLGKKATMPIQSPKLVAIQSNSFISGRRPMALLDDSSEEDITRLLELFPSATLKNEWAQFRGSKPEVCQAIAKQGDLDKIARFVANNFGRCKQHVRLFQAAPKGVAIEDCFPDSDLLLREKNKREVYLGKVRWKVLLGEPFQEEYIELLWPMRIDRRSDATLVSFVVVERDVQTFYDDRTIITQRRIVEETHVTEALLVKGLGQLDVNKGIKQLWKKDRIDAFRSTFKKARSTTTESMDRQLGIKRTNPDLYKEMILLPIHKTMFRVEAALENSIKVFQADPTDGVIRMTRYTEDEGDSDELVYAILAENG